MGRVDNNYVHNFQNYQQPILTGATIGNIDTMRVALMCPNNQFYQLLNQTYVSTYFTGVNWF